MRAIRAIEINCFLFFYITFQHKLTSRNALSALGIVAKRHIYLIIYFDPRQIPPFSTKKIMILIFLVDLHGITLRNADLVLDQRSIFSITNNPGANLPVLLQKLRLSWEKRSGAAPPPAATGSGTSDAAASWAPGWQFNRLGPLLGLIFGLLLGPIFVPNELGTELQW